MRDLVSGFITINGVKVRDPHDMTWGLSDVSAKDAGRDECATMHKMMIAQKRQYTITWMGITPSEASVILKAVNAKENFPCRLFDPMDNEFQTRTYYVGDRTTEFKIWFGDPEDPKDDYKKVYSKVSFTLIEV